MASIRSALLAGAACVAALAAPANGAQSKIEMHRKLAGEPDAAGWCEARSTLGGFSVALPGRFNDFSVRDEGADGVPLRLDVVGVGDPDGTKFSATAIVRSDGKVAADALESYARKAGGSHRMLTHAGLPAVEVIPPPSKKKSALTRMLRGKDRVYLLVAEYPQARSRDLAPAVRRFMDSFRLR
jgi:hypothetical protein